MPKIIPHPIKTDSIAVYGRAIGLRKMKYVLPRFVPIEIHPTEMELKEQVLIGHSTLFSETPNRAESVGFGTTDMFSETFSRAEAVVITHE